MSVQINYKNSSVKNNSTNHVIFSDEKYSISNLKKHVSKTEYELVSELIKGKDLKKKIISFDITSKKKIILVSLKKNLTSSNAENLGAKFYDQFKNIKNAEYNINSDTISLNLNHLVGHFLHGLKLKSYIFDKYKTKKK